LIQIIDAEKSRKAGKELRDGIELRPKADPQLSFRESGSAQNEAPER
jgi:hypothetical protein